MSRPYNQSVRSIAVIALVVWCGAIGIDPWCCPDGCTDDVGHASQPASDDDGSRDGDCILCLGSIERPADETLGSTPIEREVALRQPPLVIEIALPPPEQPPRS